MISIAGAFFAKYDLSRFRALFLAGERLDPDTYHWARALLQKPVIDHWWQTETGWPVAANCLGLTVLSVKPGSPTKPAPGYVVEILDDDGYLFIMGRVDDLIIVAGHNLLTGSMEQALSNHPDVAECAVIGVKDALKTQLPVGPGSNFKQVAVVTRVPKTRSGKVLRKTMRTIADGEPYSVPPTIDDPATLDEIAVALRTLGLAHASTTNIG